MPLLAVGVLVLAGCLGSGKENTETGDDFVAPTAPDPDNDARTCAIGGVVTDDESRPLASARLRLIKTDENNPTEMTESARDGSFSFSFVEPYQYQVLAHRDGFNPASQVIQCSPGDNLDGLQFPLAPLPPPNVPHYESRTITDNIGCSAGTPAAGQTTPDYCAQYLPDGTTMHFAQSTAKRHKFAPEADQTVTGVVYELTWDASTALSENLKLIFPGLRSDNITTEFVGIRDGNSVKGPNALKVKAQTTELLQGLLSGVQEWEIRASESDLTEFQNDPLNDGSSKIVVLQSFTLWVSFFYNGEPVPADFTALGQ